MMIDADILDVIGVCLYVLGCRCFKRISCAVTRAGTHKHRRQTGAPNGTGPLHIRRTHRTQQHTLGPLTLQPLAFDGDG